MYEPKEIICSDYSRTSMLRRSKLFSLGNPDLLSEQHLLGVIGSRDVSEYGKHLIPYIFKNLGSKEIIIVSGLSRGVDYLAHSISLDLKFKNIAVIPCGIMTVYPSIHARLAELILSEGGLFLSEYDDNQQPRDWSFIERNKVIATISDVLLVIEAGEKSGSLSTARFALKMGKKVFVIPGDIFRKNSLGIAQLIVEGATPCFSAHQINDYLNICSEPESNAVKFTTKTHKVLDYLCKNSANFDELLDLTGETLINLSNTLIELELAGRIYVEGGLYHAC